VGQRHGEGRHKPSIKRKESRLPLSTAVAKFTAEAVESRRGGRGFVGGGGGTDIEEKKPMVPECNKGTRGSI